MLYLLLVVTGILFLAHVAFLFASFQKTGFSSKNYRYSHLTLWLTGICLFLMAWLYHGKGISEFFDYFDNTSRRLFILLFTVGLSVTAHLIVRFLILPVWRKT